VFPCFCVCVSVHLSMVTREPYPHADARRVQRRVHAEPPPPIPLIRIVVVPNAGDPPERVHRIAAFNEMNCLRTCSYSNCMKMGVRFQKCSLCRVSHYCSRECQLADWRAHRPQCRIMRCIKRVHGGLRRTEEVQYARFTASFESQIALSQLPL
jgi:hypothetical protein